MVTILSAALTLPTGIEHERCTWSLMCTEQAPHWATPQPYFVPVRPTCSRMTHKSGVSASTSTSRILPLILSFAMSFLLRAAFDGNSYCCCLVDDAGRSELEGIENTSQALGKHSALGCPCLRPFAQCRQKRILAAPPSSCN